MIEKGYMTDQSSTSKTMNLDDNYDNEVWLSRLRHRTAGRDAVKRSMDYRLMKDKETRPQTPDPHDSRVSKRGWERKVQKWRTELRRNALEMHWIYVLQAILEEFLREETN